MSYTLHTHTMAVISAHQGTSLLLLVLSIAPALAQSDTGCWVNDTRVRIEENNPPGYVVTTLRATPGYNLSISSEGQSKEFEIRWPNLILKESLDYEVLPDTVFFVDLQCDDESGITVKTFVIVVEIENVNDEAPQFSQTEIIRNVSEDTQVDSPIGSPIYAEDPDKDVLFYALNGTVEALDHFILMSANNPTIIVRQALDYDTIKYLQLLLYARDTELPGANNHTATATIHVNILEADTKPPWFQPCTFPNGNSKLCISNGYESWVNVSEQASGALVLKPGPLYAIDGDTGINEPITYEIISGNQEDIFSIDNVSGNITMKKAASTLGITIFQVLASQVNDPLKYALTSVQIHVIEKSNFPPRFQSSLYHGTVPTHTDSGSLVMEYGSSNKPLQMFAIDDDFPDKLNPAITYHVQNSSEFRISRDGFVLTNATLNSATSITFLVKAVDETSTQEATTLVYVEVTPFTGPVASTTIATTLPPGTLSKTTRNPPDTTTKTSENNNNSTGTTLKPLGTAQTTTRVPPPPLSSISTAKPSGTKQTTTNTGKPATGIPSGSLVTTTRAPPLPVSSISTTKASGTKLTTINTGKPATGIPSGSLVTTTRVPPLPVSSISTTKASGTKQTTINTGKPATGIPSGSLATTTRVPPLPVSSISTAKPLGTTEPSGSGIPNPLVTTSITTGKTSGSAGPGRPTPLYTTNTEGPFLNNPQPVHFQYTAMDMAALGTSLAVLLFISVIALAFLINKLYRKPKAKGIDNSSGNTNEKGKFGTNDEKSDPTGNEKGVAALNLAFEDEEPSTKEDALNVSSLIELEKEGSSEAALSHQETQKELETDSEMKSILTKERKTDEGYKAVWFQEDIEPDNKDTKEEEGEGEDEEDDEGERNNEEGEEEDDQDDGYDGPWEDHDPIVSFSTQDVTGDTEMNEYTFM
ncbi:cadherin-related family member 5 isoform X1 [Microcaecilia unicolor]|uniref:Cadherin-related family member 5 isoform X1 n=1 Tax=Microcaecilia unicolor TaxID=1415580 RepID=A0A6P7XP62_9AMPH|nr:cadherin-related family member 5 isoform X1 [Microcaecilia unicolor]